MLQTIYESSTTKKYPIAMRLALDERVFRYCHIADVDYGVNLAAFWGHVNYQAESINHVALPVVTVVGSRDVVITDAVAALNDYADGWLIIHRAAGYRNQAYRIRGNDGTNGGLVTLHLYDPITYANSVGCSVYVHKNIYGDVLYAPLAASVAYAAFVGVPWVCPVRDEYCWLQTWGPCYGFFSNSKPGEAANNRALYFNGADGSLITGADTQGGGLDDALQYAGYTLPYSAAGGTNEVFYMLQITP